MTDMSIELRRLAAEATAREAGRLARSYFDGRAELEVELKGTQDMVSLADRSVEELIRKRLGSAFPDDGFVGEEGGADVPEGVAGIWVIDPIDGTMNFLRGVPYWSLVIAYVRGREVLIGVTYDPVHDDLYVAVKGQGAMRNGARIEVSATTDTSRAVIGHTFSFKMEVAPYVRTLGALLEAGADHRRLGSTALMMAHVADGRLDGCCTLRCSAWDVIAGLLLVREAGGYASNWFEKATLTEPSSVFGCTPALKEVIMQGSGLDG